MQPSDRQPAEPLLDRLESIERIVRTILSPIDPDPLLTEREAAAMRGKSVYALRKEMTRFASPRLPVTPDLDVPLSDPRELSHWLKASEGRRAEMLDLLPAAEVSALLHVSTPTLANWRSRRRGPCFVKIGSVVRYRRCDLLAFIGAHLIGTTSQPVVTFVNKRDRHPDWDVVLIKSVAKVLLVLTLARVLVVEAISFHDLITKLIR